MDGNALFHNGVVFHAKSIVIDKSPFLHTTIMAVDNMEKGVAVDILGHTEHTVYLGNAKPMQDLTNSMLIMRTVLVGEARNG